MLRGGIRGAMFLSTTGRVQPLSVASMTRYQQDGYVGGTVVLRTRSTIMVAHLFPAKMLSE